MKKRIFLTLVVSLVMTNLAFGFLGFGKKKEVIKIGHKNFTEQRILGAMLGIMIEENTDYKVELKELGGTMLVNEGLKSGQIDISAEYTGTGYIYLLKSGGLKDPNKIYEYVKSEFAKQGITWLGPFGFNNTYAFAVKPELAEKYNLKKVSDLPGIAEKLRVGELADFFSREDGMLGITKTYGFKFKEEIGIDSGLKYIAIDQDKIDVVVVYSTDGLLQKYKLVVLQDDKNFFPPYDAVPRMKTEFAESHPAIVKELNKLTKKFNDDDFRKYNYEADVLEYPIKKVATAALKEKGLIK